jgi:hypothetical protein
MTIDIPLVVHILIAIIIYKIIRFIFNVIFTAIVQAHNNDATQHESFNDRLRDRLDSEDTHNKDTPHSQ